MGNIISSKPSTDAYRTTWERVYGKKKKKEPIDKKEEEKK